MWEPSLTQRKEGETGDEGCVVGCGSAAGGWQGRAAHIHNTTQAQGSDEPDTLLSKNTGQHLFIFLCRVSTLFGTLALCHADKRLSAVYGKLRESCLPRYHSPANVLLFNAPAKACRYCVVGFFCVIFNHHPGQLLGVAALLLAEGKRATKTDL